MIHYTKNYRKNLELFWQQFDGSWSIPTGYHVHHIKPKCCFVDESDIMIHHPSNLIALHPDDHYTIHKLRGDKKVNKGMLTSIAGRVVSDETRAKMSASRKGIIFSEVTRQRIGAGNKGKIISDETKAKASKFHTGRIKSDTERSAISAGMLAKAPVKCPHCSKTGAQNLMTRYHFDNCKNRIHFITT